VSLEDVADVVRVEGLGVDKDELDDEDFKLATRWAVAGVIADICMGGSSKGFGFFGSVEESVYQNVSGIRRVEVLRAPCPASYPSSPRYDSHYDPCPLSSASLIARCGAVAHAAQPPFISLGRFRRAWQPDGL